MNELKERFDALTEGEKIEFMKLILPEVQKMFKNNPEQMTQTFLPFFKDVLKDNTINIPQLLFSLM